MSFMSVEFCDTNVLGYAHDTASPAKHQQAEQLVARLWQSGDGAISVQVLQELFAYVTRKLRPPLPVADARSIIAVLTAWRVFAPDANDVLEAIDASARWQVSFWDAMVLTAARKSQATILWSEDLNDGQNYDGVVVRNPFRSL